MHTGCVDIVAGCHQLVYCFLFNWPGAFSRSVPHELPFCGLYNIICICHWPSYSYRQKVAVIMATTFAACAVRQGVAKCLELAISGALMPLYPWARPVSVFISVTGIHLVLAAGFSRLSWACSWLSAETLSILLIIGCIEPNPGPVLAELQVLLTYIQLLSCCELYSFFANSQIKMYLQHGQTAFWIYEL